jgi:hypothetical protein
MPIIASVIWSRKASFGASISWQSQALQNVFYFKNNGSITELQIRAATGDGGEKLVWHLRDNSLFAHDTWMVGQVKKEV